VLATLLERPASDIPSMVRAEQLIELALCVAHPQLQRTFEVAQAEGRAVWCVSDTYHDAAFLRELLESCGYALDGVDVVSSADMRMSKGDGRLLRHLAKAAALEPASILHIGDHPESDGTIPFRQGFRTVVHPWAASRHSDAPAAGPGDSIALGLSQIGARAIEPPFPFWWRFGYSVAGPLLSAFALWLRAKFAADGIDRAYFLLRDGEIIEQVYRILGEASDGPQTALLESSRRAFVVPAIEAGRRSITSQLLAYENARPAGEFLERVGLQATAFAAAFRAVGLQPDTVIERTDAEGLDRVMRLFAQTEVATALLQQSRTERAMLWKYLTQEGVLAPGRIALVDIGWSGTIQKALLGVASLQRSPVDVHGYYLGTLHAIESELEGSSASGFLFHAGAPAQHARAILQLRQLVEFICTTERGSLRGFRLDGSTVVPVHSAVDHPDAQRGSIAHLHDGALTFARSLLHERRVFGAHAITPDAALRHLDRTILRPTAEEARAIGDLHHGEGLGADRLRAFARFSDGPITPTSVLRDHAGAYWPAGLHARREPAALALRALLWLRGA
jgi:predicted HAD superfamily hydrolase